MIPVVRVGARWFLPAAFLIVCSMSERAVAGDDPTDLRIRAGWCVNHIIRIPVDVEGNRLELVQKLWSGSSP